MALAEAFWTKDLIVSRKESGFSAAAPRLF
jgi:hypothetical protein